MLETQQAINNTIYLDVDVSGHAIYWMTGCGGYGTYNTFNGYWHGAAGNCPTMPNANYVYTDDTSWMANIATNTFNPAEACAEPKLHRTTSDSLGISPSVIRLILYRLVNE